MTFFIKHIVFFPIFLTMFFSIEASAAFAAYDFKGNEDLEKRYFQISDAVRCPKCQNQNISGSNAMIAQDMRKKIHQLLMEGRSDSEIYTYLVDRYGDFVLYKPPVRKSTWLLWFGPLMVFLLLCLVWWLKFFNSKKLGKTVSVQPVESLTDAEQKRLEAMTTSSTIKQSHHKLS